MKKAALVASWSGYEKAVRGKDVFEQKDPIGIPLGVIRLQHNMQKKGFDTEVFDPNLYKNPAANLKLFLRENNIGMIGFSSLHSTLEHDCYLSHKVREWYPDMPIIFGGPEATFNHKTVFEGSKADACALGEGEKTLEEILSLLKRQGSSDSFYKGLSDIPGLFIRRDSRDIEFTGHRPQLNEEEYRETVGAIDITKVDTLSYKAMDNNNSRWHEVTTNYCPGNCSFCSSTNFLKEATGKAAKMHSVDSDSLFRKYKAAAENSDIIQFGILDDNFFFGRRLQKRAMKFFSKVINYRNKSPSARRLKMILQSRIDSIHPKVLEYASRAGVSLIGYGVENLSVQGHKSMGKKTSLSQIMKTLVFTKKYKIKPWANVIIGSPYNTTEGILQNVGGFEVLDKIGVISSVYPYVIPFHGCNYMKAEPFRSNIIYDYFDVGDTGIKIKKPVRIPVLHEETGKPNEQANELLQRALDYSKGVGDKIMEKTGGVLDSPLVRLAYDISLIHAAKEMGIDPKATVPAIISDMHLYDFFDKPEELVNFSIDERYNHKLIRSRL